MRKPHADANKADPVIDALELISGHEWRKRGLVYECRANHTHANNIEVELQDYGIEVKKEVSPERSGRYFLTVSTGEAQRILNAAGTLAAE